MESPTSKVVAKPVSKVVKALAPVAKADPEVVTMVTEGQDNEGYDTVLAANSAISTLKLEQTTSCFQHLKASLQ